jgi:hypothetical protein
MYLPLHKPQYICKDTFEIALHIENTAELLGKETGLANSMVEQLHNNCSRLSSRRKIEVSVENFLHGRHTPFCYWSVPLFV